MVTMPAQKPGRSEQVVCTPDDFLAAFRLHFGPIVWDLAATSDNSVTRDGRFYGPGSSFGENGLTADWSWLIDGNLWLNPEFGQIGKWAAKCLREARGNLFVPLSSANWAREYVWGKAMVYPLNPRITFKGHKTAYPKDMMLVRYGTGEVGCELWRWK